MMKKISYAIVFAIILSLASACSSSNGTVSQTSSDNAAPSSESAQTQQRTFVLFTGTKTEPQTESYIKYIIEPFEQAHPDIKIDWQPTANWDETLKIQMAGGNGPDLMDLNGPTDAVEYFESGRLLDLAPYVQERGWDKMFYDWALNVCKTNDGAVTGLPVAYEGMMMWYNNALMEQYGWEYPNNLTEFSQICTEAKDAGLIPVAFGSSGFNRINEWWLSSALSAYADTSEVDQLLKGSITFQDESIRGAFDLFVRMWKDGWISNSDSVALTFDDARALFTQGRAAFIMEGTWYYQTLSATDMDYAMGLIPSFKESGNPVFPAAVSRVMAINKDAENVDDMIEFIDYLVTNEENYIQSVLGGNQPLPIHVDLSGHTGQMEEKMADMTNLMLDAEKKGDTGYCFWTFFPQNTRIYLYENLDNVLLDVMSLDDYLNQAQEILNQDIAAGNVPQID